MEGADQSSLELGEVEVKISKFALQLSTPQALIFQNSMKSVRIKAGEEFSLICEVQGRPTPKILWYKNNLQIKRQLSHYSYINYGIRIINSRTSELKYQFLTTSDSGNYTCHAQNIYGHVQKSINIEVQYITTTESTISTSSVVTKETSDETIQIFNQFVSDQPCFTDHDCLRNPCKIPNSFSKRVSYKTCVCTEKSDLPKCQLVEYQLNKVFSNNEQTEKNSFQTCKDGCDPNTSRLFLLSVLSLLLFLLVVFLIMVFITKRQRSRYKLTYSSTKINTNSNQENQKCLLIDKKVGYLDSSNNTSPSFNWDIVNPKIYSEGDNFFTIQPSITKGDEIFYLENKRPLKLDTLNHTSKSKCLFLKKKIFSPLTYKERNQDLRQNDNTDSNHQASFTNAKKHNNHTSSNIVMKTLNKPLRKLEESSLNSLNEIL